MILADCHVHSSFSDDCDTAVEQMIETAILQGRKYFYITDHHDFDYPAMDDGVTFQLAQDPYIQRMEELKHQYKNKIDIRIGVELGLMAHIKEKTVEKETYNPQNLNIMYTFFSELNAI